MVGESADEFRIVERGERGETGCRKREGRRRGRGRQRERYEIDRERKSLKR